MISAPGTILGGLRAKRKLCPGMYSQQRGPEVLVVGDLPLTIHRDSYRPTDKPECMVRRSIASRCVSSKSHVHHPSVATIHDFRCNQDTAVVWKFAHLVHILVVAGIDNRVHLTRIYAPHCTRGGAGPTTQSDSQTGFTLPLVLHRPMRTVRQQPARK